LITIVAFILALRFLSNPATARRGNQIGAVGMLVAIVVTFLQDSVMSYWEIAAGMVVMLVRVQHVANGLVRDRLHQCQDVGVIPIEHVVDEHDTVVGHLHRDVAAFSRDHVEVAPDAFDAQRARWLRRLCISGQRTSAKNNQGDGDSAADGRITLRLLPGHGRGLCHRRCAVGRVSIRGEIAAVRGPHQASARQVYTEERCARCSG